MSGIDAAASQVPHPAVSPVPSEEVEAVAVRGGHVALFRHTLATGGVIVINQHAPCRLTPVQFAFLEVLVRQMSEDEDKHESVRGFVSSGVLLCSLPWDTAHPDLSHLKQLVRRVRRRLVGTGVSVQSWCGLGYRLST